uniref:Uncharacterized protein n=1 Tax=Plectus sambesii TaxID=2011161 RepID=A0A914VSR3_9BILA
VYVEPDELVCQPVHSSRSRAFLPTDSEPRTNLVLSEYALDSMASSNV